eukprot:3362140-Pleurochrysis_carterae.AAC.4
MAMASQRADACTPRRKISAGIGRCGTAAPAQPLPTCACVVDEDVVADADCDVRAGSDADADATADAAVDASAPADAADSDVDAVDADADAGADAVCCPSLSPRSAPRSAARLCAAEPVWRPAKAGVAKDGGRGAKDGGLGERSAQKSQLRHCESNTADTSACSSQTTGCGRRRAEDMLVHRSNATLQTRGRGQWKLTDRRKGELNADGKCGTPARSKKATRQKAEKRRENGRRRRALRERTKADGRAYAQTSGRAVESGLTPSGQKSRVVGGQGGRHGR